MEEEVLGGGGGFNVVVEREVLVLRLRFTTVVQGCSRVGKGGGGLGGGVGRPVGV